MAKKNKNKNKETAIEDYYELKVDKINELVAALTEEDPVFEDEVDFGMNANMGVNDPKNVKRSGKEKQFDPYKTDFLSKVPVWIKAMFVKWWFAGMVCWFFMFGIGQSGLDAVALIGLVLGIVVDILVNPIFRYMETDRKEYNAYMMFPFPFKAIWTFFANVCYYMVVMIGVNYCYLGINLLINEISSSLEHFVAVEPLLFGILAFIVDMIFIGVKDGAVALVRHAKNKNKEKALNV